MFLNRYKEGGLRLLAQDFMGSDSEAAFAEFQKKLEGYEILLASSAKTGCTVDVFVLTRRDGKLYSQQDYCCDHGKGFAGWWRMPAEIHHPDSAEAILRRMEASGLGEGNSHAGNEFREELRQVLAEHRAKYPSVVWNQL